MNVQFWETGIGIDIEVLISTGTRAMGNGSLEEMKLSLRNQLT